MSKKIAFDTAKFAKDGMTTTPEGYLRGEVIATRTGVFNYMGLDGKVVRRLRHPDDVFLADSLATLKNIPITLDHPSVLVAAENAKRLSVGYVGENVYVDGAYIRVPITITDADAIKAVQAGKSELSLGYQLNLKPEQDTYNGIDYDERQIDIYYNHLAIVDVARAGPMAKINLDGADENTANISVQQDGTPAKDDKVIDPCKEDAPQMSDKLKKVQLDNGCEYDAAPEVVNELTTKQKALDDYAEKMKDLEEKISKLTAERDTLKQEMDKEKEKSNDAAIAAKVKELVTMTTTAKKHGVEVKDGMTAQDIKVAVINKTHPKLELDGKDAAYINASYDIIVQNGPQKATDNMSSYVPNTANDDGGEVDFGKLSREAANAKREAADKAFNRT